MDEEKICPDTQAAYDLADAIVSSKKAGHSLAYFLQVAELVWPMVKDYDPQHPDKRNQAS